MRRILGLILAFAVLLSLVACQNGRYPETSEKVVDYSEYFGAHKGCAVFYNENVHGYDIYNKPMIDTKISPCSTFKILLAAAGLKFGVLENKDTKFEWDGIEREYPNWNQDLTLEQAFKFSAVWYFTKVYEKIGHENIAALVKQLKYGNADASFRGKFWLNSSLKISAKEQVDFLVQLFNGKLLFEEQHLAIVKDIMFAEEIGGGRLFGKTGTYTDVNIGWFVGFYEKNGSRVYFAVRLFEGDAVSGATAKEILKKIILHA